VERSVGWHRLFFSTRTEDQNRLRGTPDTVFLLLVLLMLVCGTVMSYSASAVYGEQFYNDSTYFLKRYVLYALLSVCLTVPYVLFAKPAFFNILYIRFYFFKIGAINFST
jgi:cell division protein FtsW (lipid II flippase)